MSSILLRLHRLVIRLRLLLMKAHVQLNQQLISERMMNQMFDFLPVRLDLSISQGTTLNRAVWNARTGSGAVVDLTNANGVCYITTSQCCGRMQLQLCIQWE